MPFNMFKAFSGSRNRTHRGDPSIYTDYPQGYPPATSVDFQPEPTIRPRPQIMRRSSSKLQRREPVFTPLPSRTPTDADDYNEGFIRVDSPDAVLGGVLNARPGKIASALPSLGLPVEHHVSETLSEREHHEHAARSHNIPRLLDRPPQLQRAGSFHSGRGERVNPDEPIIMSASPSRSSASGSDHTIEALRTPLSMHPSERVIPPLPRNYSGSYMPGSRSPTDIYGTNPYEVVHDARSHHNSEIYIDRYGRASGYDKDGPIYYIIPGGMNVIFQDEHGNEITRVGDFSGRPRPSRPGPFVVQDEHGRELYRYDSYERGSHRGYSEPQIVQVDTYPSSSHHRRDRSYSSHSYPSDPSYRRGHEYHPDHREYRGYGEKDWRDPSHRDHRYRGHADSLNRGEYRDHRGYRDPGTYREYGGYREQGYREHEDYRLQGRPEMAPPRVSSRASHRSYSHAGQMPLERPHQHYSNPISDDRLSERDYAASHMQHDEAELSGGLEALRI